MSESKEVNPLREGLYSRAIPEPCAVVIFGATGDLTHRKLVPALYNLAADGALPPAVSVVGFARRDKNDEVFRKELEEAARKFSRQQINEELWTGFASSIFITAASSTLWRVMNRWRNVSTSWMPSAGRVATGSFIFRQDQISSR